MILLALDTPTQACSAALVKDGRLLGERLSQGSAHHAAHLLHLVDGIVRDAGLEISQIDACAVTVGPGSFTGLRTGIATARGLAFAHGASLVGISSLEALACQAGCSGALVCPMIDARRDQIYTCLYRVDGAGDIEVVLPETAVDPEAWLSGLHEPVVCVGSGAVRYARAIAALTKGMARVAPAWCNTLRASTVAWRAAAHYARGGAGAGIAGDVLYVREPDAREPHLPVARL